MTIEETRSGFRTCPPTWGTPRRLERPTWGPLVGQISARLGKPFMPWQQYVMDVALEIDPLTGFLCYQDVIVSVPRQSGKTTITLPRIVWRAETSRLLGGRQTMLYAAQKAIAAKKKWEREFVFSLKAAPVMAGRFRTRKPAGNEHVLFRDGSTFAPIATQPTSGHGDTLDDGTLDEAFSQADATVEDAWRPAMIARSGYAQFWIASTVGFPGIYLRSRMIKGRAAVRSGMDRGMAHFEWSAGVDVDVMDPAQWWGWMPALGHTIRPEGIQYALDNMEGGLPAFRRAYGNQWPDEFDDLEWIVPKASWSACQDENSTRVALPSYSVAVDPDRVNGALAFAARRADGLPMVGVTETGPGASWLPAAVGAAVRRTGAVSVVIDSAGGESNLKADIEGELKELREPVPVRAMTTSDVCNSWSSFEDTVTTEQLRHLGQKVLTDALRSATLRPIGKRHALDHFKSTGDITALVACEHALWGLTTTPPPPGPWAMYE